ncbi:MAG TPA: DNA methyltransferase [Acidimicrobiia bacterium]
MSVDLRHGDCVELMRAMPDNSVDSIVTDPPYGLEFMGKDWDAPWKAKPSREFNDIEEGTLGGFTKLPNHSRVNNVRCEACQRWKFSSNPCACHKPQFPNARLDALTVYQQWFTEVAAEALRVLKPGGHLLAFGGTRTYHRMACAIEDAGFEIRDSIHWVYGSGFPKSLNVGKAIDKRRDDRDDVLRVTGEIARLRDAAGLTNRDLDGLFGFAGMAGHWTSTKSQPTVPTPEQWTVLRERLEPPQWLDDEVWRLNGRKGTPGEAWGQREVVGERDVPVGHSFAGPVYGGDSSSKRVDVTAPATDEARRWEGWGTALKPAHEPIVVARKPLSGTVAGNVLEWGTGGLNIDGCRVGTDAGWSYPNGRGGTAWGGRESLAGNLAKPMQASSGRWPANIVLDGAAAAALDQQSGVSKSPAPYVQQSKVVGIYGAEKHHDRASTHHGDSGGASRFFTQADFGPDDWPFVYQAKPSKRERNAGLDGLSEQSAGSLNMRTDAHAVKTGNATQERQNHHPTVKPVALMRHLVRLVTPPGGVVLDPFAGSGTTLVAAVLEGFDAIGCEMTDEYLPIIRGRVAWAEEQAFVREELAKAQPDQPTLL